MQPIAIDSLSASEGRFSKPSGGQLDVLLQINKLLETVMLILLIFLIVLPQPFVLFLCLAGGLDGERAAHRWAAATIPIMACAVYAVYTLVRGDKLNIVELVVIAGALVPYLVALWVFARDAVSRNR